MTVMDPWRPSSDSTSPIVFINKPYDFPSTGSFEDNFEPSVSDTLPDSDQYLATLEEKLRKLQNDPNILQQLSAKREACMHQLLSNGAATQFVSSEDEELPLNNSQILLRTLGAQKHALNQTEIHELVKYDQLNNNSSSDAEE